MICLQYLADVKTNKKKIHIRLTAVVIRGAGKKNYKKKKRI